MLPKTLDELAGVFGEITNKEPVAMHDLNETDDGDTLETDGYYLVATPDYAQSVGAIPADMDDLTSHSDYSVTNDDIDDETDNDTDLEEV